MISEREKVIVAAIITSLLAIPNLESMATVRKGAPSGRIIEYGIYEYGGAKNTVASPGTATGTVSYGSPSDVRLMKETNIVPIKKGVIFGYKWRVDGVKAGVPFDITYRVDHPPILNSNGVRSQRSEGVIRCVPISSTYDMISSYRLSEDYELVPGIWTITILLGNQVIANMSFQIVVK